jgi:hypothetical protein
MKRDEIGGNCSLHGKIRSLSTHRILVGNHDWKRPLRRPKHVLEDILDLKDISEDID